MKLRILPSLRDILFVSVMVSVLLLGPVLFNQDGDLGRHITIGNTILQERSIPTQDIYSHSMLGQPLTPHEWLTQVLYALFHHFWGLSGAVLLASLVIAFTFFLVYQDSQQRSRLPILSLAITFLAVTASSLHWLARPHVFTFLFVALWIFSLERVQRNKPAPIWIFALIMLVWANSHGAFIAGFVIWAAYLGGDLLEAWTQQNWLPEKFYRWLTIGLLSFAVTLLNPAGLHLWETSFGFISNEYLVSRTHEYLPPNFHLPGTWPFLGMISLSIFLTAAAREKMPYSHALLLAGWTAMGLYSARNIPLYAIAAAPILAETASKVVSDQRYWIQFEGNIQKIEQSLKGWLWMLTSTVIAMMFMWQPAMQAYNRYDAREFPVEAVNWLQENPQEGNVFNYFPWDGYLLYRSWPDRLVFIDGQTDFYGEALTREYEQVLLAGVQSQQIMEKYDIWLVLVPPDVPIGIFLAEDNNWVVIYQDQTSIIFRRK